ncbi:MBL fold metallo-hydrolase (plasmid) [Ralstonia solanacearum]|uniref:MBL fold metallo-hydrolase n=2 Tax=Ralstonia solanacearum species complex TaxID=3116862 RepID=A0A454TJM3_9RALS|nr:MBL fold metallo-hydrolase [Ralstonia pseudosolanacearum]AUS45230.1 MBL fold metallo-hydrolase [Ralstonia solanacearum]AYA48828.1 MBL fold metallo-hydrolase [Ralstonia pseudosolanacearum]MCK4135161.1 MBL fold metallo-hydrolase [Ralstonia pseudosolanacearum]MCK4144965.1 MBL fold metallo-hydrolase [Ralstonia pseudosolanacearum]MDK1383264.1 MBL fold metallo-hydrolase [Ralstonia pseudosolanacearum]
MSADELYLRGDIVAEPLVSGWYAWTHLISPATLAMNVVGRHLKIMASFVHAPKVHVAAVKNPKMLGGPFIDYAESRVAEVQSLIEQTRSEQARLIAFAEGVHQLNALLKRAATGAGLDDLYAQVPDCLRGYVELFYDARHQPTFRLYESLLYRSAYYDRTAQSLQLHVTQNDHRPFVLSTPRLPDATSVCVQLPFESPVLDRFFRARYEPTPVSRLADELGIAQESRALFRSFFTSEPPAARQRYQGEQARIRFFGHACLLLETRAFSLITDPVVSFPYRGANSRYTYEDLPPFIDYVLITHNHQDHVLLETLLQLRHMIGTVIVPRGGNGELQDPSLKLALQALGFKRVVELDELESLELPGGKLTGLPFLGEHADLGIRTKLCYHVAIGGWSTLFAADACIIDPQVYRHAHEIVGDIDVLYLGMECDGAPLSWLYGPLLSEPLTWEQDRSRTLSGSNFARARELVEMFGPNQVYVYAMGQEPWLNHIMAVKYTETSLPIVESNRLLDYCRERGIVAERLYCMKETFHADAAPVEA